MDDYLPNIQGTVGPQGGMVRHNNINRVVQFYMGRRHLPLQSQEKGSPVYDDQVMFKSFCPGEQRYEVVERPATRADQQNYPMQWQAFQQNREHIPDGFPIDNLHPESPSVAATLRGIGIHTIEQCAEMNATSVDSIMGGQKYKNDAQRFLELAQKSVTASRFNREITTLQSENRTLANTIEQLKAQVAALQDQSVGNQGPDPALVQAVVSAMQGQSGMGRRATMPLNPSPNYDAQTAQINATHPTADVARQRKIRRKAGASS